MSLNMIRHILGYCLGFFMFVLVIPIGLGALAKSWPLQVALSPQFRWGLAVPIAIIGLIFVAWSNLDLFKVGKGGPTDLFNMALSPRSQHLVVTGPYRFTRNPMVFGAFTLYLAVTVWLASLSALIALALFFCTMLVYIKQTEEKRLLHDFGEEYLAYKKQVPMIVPFTRGKIK